MEFGDPQPSDFDVKSLYQGLINALKEYEKIDQKTLNHHHIDNFLEHLKESLHQAYKRLEVIPTNQYVGDYLADIELLIATSDLGDELTILALFKTVEIQAIRFIKNLKPSLSVFQPKKEGKRKGQEKKFFLSEILQELKEKQFISSIRYENSYNELRLLNNSIKHQGLVNKDLAEIFPKYGNEDDELKDLDKAYTRLKPEIKFFFADLFDNVYTCREETK